MQLSIRLSILVLTIMIAILVVVFSQRYFFHGALEEQVLYSEKDDAADDDIQGFPWPPPRPSANDLLPEDLFQNAKNLGDVDAILSEAFERTGYFEKSYYEAPGGFVVISRLEQFESNGESSRAELRWNEDISPIRWYHPEHIIRALFAAREGRYRIIAFMTANQVFHTDPDDVSADEIRGILEGGANALPQRLRSVELGAGHHVTALIYEFSKSDAYPEAKFVVPSNLPGRTHLQRAGLYDAIVRASP